MVDVKVLNVFLENMKFLGKMYVKLNLPHKDR